MTVQQTNVFDMRDIKGKGKVMQFQTDIDVEHLADVILKKEKTIIKTKPHSIHNGKYNDGQTGLGPNSLTARFDAYNVLKWKEGKEIKDWITRCYKEFYPDYSGELLVQCWANVMRNAQQIRSHSHFPDNYDNTLCGHLNVRTRMTGTWYEGDRIPNEEGQMVLFSPHLFHWTDPCVDEPRITVAFDVMPRRKRENLVILKV